jgi:hypothetical protein
MLTVIITSTDSQDESELYCEWFRCRNCREDDITPWSNYCPNCGAKIIRPEVVDLKEEEVN